MGLRGRLEVRATVTVNDSIHTLFFRGMKATRNGNYWVVDFDLFSVFLIFYIFFFLPPLQLSGMSARVWMFWSCY